MWLSATKIEDNTLGSGKTNVIYLLLSSSIFFYLLLFQLFTFSPLLRHLIELLDNREDEEGGKQADAHQGAPDDVERHVPHVARNADELVAESRCYEPSAHHHALVLRRSHLRDKRDADGRKQQFGKGQDEVSADEQVGVEVIDVIGMVGCRQADAADRH